MSTAAQVLDAAGPEQIRAGISTAVATARQHAGDLGGIAGVLGEASDRYETLQMSPSTLGHLRAAAAAITAAAAALGTAEEQLQAAAGDFNARDGQVADTVAGTGNLMDPAGYTETIVLPAAAAAESAGGGPISDAEHTTQLAGRAGRSRRR